MSNNIKRVLNKIFGVENLIKPDQIKGQLPTSREAYGTAINLAAPAVAEMVFIALIGIINTVMVSGLGAYAIAAVGLTGQPRMLFMAVLMALNVGVTAIVSRRKGEGDKASANLCLMQGLMLALVLGIVLSVVAYFSTPALIRLVGAQDDTFEPAVQYLRIVGVTLILPALTASITAAQRGVGNTKISFKINFTASIVNVVFNLLLIEGNLGFPRLEVMGAGISTALGTLAGFLVAAHSLLNRDGYLSLHSFGKFHIDIPMAKSMFKIGSSAMLEQVFLRFGFFMYSRIVADLGTFYLAAHLICMQMMNLTFTIGDGLAVASSALVGQSLGRKRPDMSIIYGKISQRLALCASTLMLGVILALRYIFAGLFTQDPALIEVVASTLIIMAIVQPIQTSHVVMGGSLRGAGDTRFVAFTMLITVAVMRPLFAVILMYPLAFGLAGAWLAILFDQGARLTMLYTRFSRGRWTSIRV